MIPATQPGCEIAAPISSEKKAAIMPQFDLPPELYAHWEVDTTWARLAPEGGLIVEKLSDESPGSESGIIGRLSLHNLTLHCDVYLEPNTIFLAKIHQTEARNQLTNSYHLMCRGAQGYVARHGHIFSRFTLPTRTWCRLAFSYSDGAISLRNNGARLVHALDETLTEGYCFLGVKRGTARLRNIRIEAPNQPGIKPDHGDYEVLCSNALDPVPTVSIITTVFDRVECLRRCVKSVLALNYRDYEHIVVADSPPAPMLQSLTEVISGCADSSRKPVLATLRSRKNDWGISPAGAGLALARGKYVCFLSDDNGYLPSHFDKLVSVLNSNSEIGFVYSSCLYAGRAVLRTSPPRPGTIDLGQPLFRRELFSKCLGGTIPFHEFGWDWKMIEAFLQSGVQCKHVDDATFIFRLANYPQFEAGASHMG